MIYLRLWLGSSGVGCVYGFRVLGFRALYRGSFFGSSSFVFDIFIRVGNKFVYYFRLGGLGRYGFCFRVIFWVNNVIIWVERGVKKVLWFFMWKRRGFVSLEVFAFL